MKVDVPANLNNYIHFSLDNKGKEILMKYYNTDSLNLWRSEKYEWMYTLQMWIFVDIFGGHSAGSYSPYNAQVIIEIEENDFAKGLLISKNGDVNDY